MRLQPSTVRDLLKRTCGIRPVPRRRWELRLSSAEQKEISREYGVPLRRSLARSGVFLWTAARHVTPFRYSQADLSEYSLAVVSAELAARQPYVPGEGT